MCSKTKSLFGTTWTVEEIKNVTAQFERRSAIECTILCKWDSNSIAWHASPNEEKIIVCIIVWWVIGYSIISNLYSIQLTYKDSTLYRTEVEDVRQMLIYSFIYILQDIPGFVIAQIHYCHNTRSKLRLEKYTLIARFMGPTRGPSEADRTQVGPMLAPLTLQSG